MNLIFGSFVLVQFSVQNLLRHLNLGFEAVWILVALVWFESVLIGSLSVRAGSPDLSLFSEHNCVPQFQPLEQTAVRKLQRSSNSKVLSVVQLLCMKDLFFYFYLGSYRTELTSSLRSSVYCRGENLSTHRREV